MKTVEQLVAAIDDIPGTDPEAARGELDTLLLEQFPAEVRIAVAALRGRCSWWAAA